MKSFAKYAAVFAAAMSVASVASAGTATFVNPDAHSGYGYTSIGTGVSAGPTNYTASGDGPLASIQAVGEAWAGFENKNLVFTRIFDTGPVGALRTNVGGPPGTPAGLAAGDGNGNFYTDALWSDGVVDLSLRARYAARSQRVGTTSDLNANYTTFVDLDAGVSQFPAGTTLTTPAEFRWGRSQTTSTSAVHLSDATNPDRMITFLVQGFALDDLGQTTNLLGTPTFAIFFEDLTDMDYNDAAILFQFASRGADIPLPGAAAMGLALMGGAGLTRARRRMA